MLWTDLPGKIPREITNPQYVGFLVLLDGFFCTTSKILIISRILNFVRLKFINFWVLATVCFKKLPQANSFCDAIDSMIHSDENTKPLA